MSLYMSNMLQLSTRKTSSAIFKLFTNFMTGNGIILIVFTGHLRLLNQKCQLLIASPQHFNKEARQLGGLQRKDVWTCDKHSQGGSHESCFPSAFSHASNNAYWTLKQFVIHSCGLILLVPSLVRSCKYCCIQQPMVVYCNCAYGDQSLSLGCNNNIVQFSILWPILPHVLRLCCCCHKSLTAVPWTK